MIVLPIFWIIFTCSIMTHRTERESDYMTSILMQQIIVLFLMMACGYGLVKGKLLTTKDSRVLSILSIYLIIPFVIIKAF